MTRNKRYYLWRMDVLNLIIAEASLETIPKEIWDEPSVVAYCRKRRKDASRCLLDVAYHHQAARKLKDSEKRGRPDIVHSALLAALETPLNKEGLLRVYVHTYRNHIMYVSPKVRLPKNYNNFVGLIEQLFEIGQVPPKGESLLSIENGNLDELLAKLRPDYVIALTTEGRLLSFGELASRLLSFERPAVLVGGFQRGHFSEGTMSLANEAVSVGKFHFMASVVIARLIYELELKTGVYEKIIQE